MGENGGLLDSSTLEDNPVDLGGVLIDDRMHGRGSGIPLLLGPLCVRNGWLEPSYWKQPGCEWASGRGSCTQCNPAAGHQETCKPLESRPDPIREPSGSLFHSCL